MKLLSIEPTPNPNSMKLNLNESLPEGVRLNFTSEQADRAPMILASLLRIPGIKSVYQVADFVAIERNPKYDWRPILSAARQVLEGNGTDGGRGIDESKDSNQEDSFGEVHVLVQMFRGIPMQIKLLSGLEDVRVALPPRFKQAASEATIHTQNFLQERKWVDRGLRYGDLKEIGEEEAALISAAYDETRLKQLVEDALKLEFGQPVETETLSPEIIEKRLEDPDWRKRYAALEQLVPEASSIPLLVKAIHDSNSSIRRLAVVYLGSIGTKELFPYLFEALKDSAVSVRRAAGDCLSDLGDKAAIGPMIECLKDPSKIVRWRAARFLYEVGDVSAIPALKQAQDDPEFEVSLQVKLALERIEGGHEAKGPVWQQMTKGLESNESEQP